MQKGKYYVIISCMFLLLLCGCKKSNKDFEKSCRYTDNNTTSEEKNSDNITVNLSDGEKLVIDSKRFNDDLYGTGQLFNRWDIEEEDKILNSIKGYWKVNKYVGFIASSICYPDLFDPHDNLSSKYKKQLIKEYDKAVNEAKKTLPDVNFSVKMYNGKEAPDCNDLIVQDGYISPISIILSKDRNDDNYPIFFEQTTISYDLGVKVEYPVIYIKFFYLDEDKNGNALFKPATLVLSSNNKQYLLINGAFYSLIKYNVPAK